MYVGIVELKKMAEDDLCGVDTNIKETQDTGELIKLDKQKSELNIFLGRLAFYRAK